MCCHDYGRPFDKNRFMIMVDHREYRTIGEYDIVLSMDHGCALS